MVESAETKNIGLRGITVADTKISKVDGAAGLLYYRGYSILDLAENSTFEETANLLLYGDLPNRRYLKIFDRILKGNRDIPEDLKHTLRERPAGAGIMNVLQAAIPLLADHDPRAGDDSKTANYDRAIQLIAKLPTIVAYRDRVRRGLPPVEPRQDLSHAANFLYMLNGKEPDPGAARDFDVCLVLHADHTFNASTFSAREVASTRASMYAAASAAVGALSGDLHGGANTRVMEMLLKIGKPEDVDSWVKNELEGGGKIFGMGHAVYKTWDPRAKVLGPMCKRLGEAAGDTKWYDLSTKVMEAAQREMKQLKGVDIYPNVDFFGASVYYQLGIPVELNTAMFALSRIAGWCAHVIEEKFAEAQPKPALYRPRAEYIGNYCGPEGCVFKPLKDRE